MKISFERSFLRGLTISALAFLLSACGEKSVDDVIGAARSKAADGDNATAMTELRSGMQMYPTSALLRLEFARLLSLEGNHANAQIELRKLLSETELANRVVPLLAKSMVHTGQFERAIADFENHQINDKAAQADLLATMALAHGSLRRADRARALADESLRLQPNGVAARLVLARLKAVEGGPAAAIAMVDEALKLQPTDADAWMLRGDLQVATGVPPHADALPTFQKVIDLAPGSVLAHAAVVGIHLAQKDLAATEKALAKMRRKMPNHPQGVFFQAQLEYAKGNDARAAELISAVLKATPNAVNALVYAGAIELRRGGLAQAEGFLSKALAQAPDRINAKRLLAATHIKAGAPAKAIDLLKPIVLAGAAGVDRESLLLFAEAHLLQGDYQKAQQYFQQALAMRPDDASVKTALALMGAAQGKLEQAVGELSALSAAGTDIAADKALISTLLGRRDADRALAAIATLEKKQPNSALAATLTGYALLIKADRSGARSAFELALTRDPKFASAAVSLAALDLKDGKVKNAIARHEALLKLDPKNIHSLISLAEISAIDGAKKEDVVKLYEAAISAHPTEALPRRLLVHYLIARNDFRAAALAADVASTALPRSVEMLETLAQAQLMAGNTNQAVTTLRRSISMSPNRASPYTQLANTLQVAGDLAGVELNFKQATVVEPQNVQAKLNLASFYLRQKNYAKAIGIAKQLQKALPDEAAPDVLEGDVHVAAGNIPLALEAFRRGLNRKHVANAPIRVHTALLALKQGDQAKKFSMEWRAKAPKDMQFIAYLGRRALERDELPEAEALHREAVNVMVEPDAALLNNLAWVLVRAKSQDAIKFAEQAHGLAPKRTEIIDTYAQALAGGGRFSDAVKVLSDATTTYPANIDLRLTLANTYVLAGDRVKAKELISALKAAVKIERHKKALANIESQLSG